MNLRIQNCTIIEPGSLFNGQKRTIEIEDGIVTHIGEGTGKKVDQEINIPNLHISPSWVDTGVHYQDPGRESWESLQQLAEVALAGGVGHIIGFANTKPTVQTKNSLSYFQNFSQSKPTKFWNLAALTKDCEGAEFTEWQDLHVHGAIGFSDGDAIIRNSDILLKAIQYVSPLGSRIVIKSADYYLSYLGQMHEGLQSMLLGLKGIPSESEELGLLRDLKILEYAGVSSKHSVLHFSSISTKQGVALIRKVKQDGLPISADVSVMNLMYTDKDIETFDTNFKLWPPLRSEEDRQALLLGIQDGTIDIIKSDHHAIDAEHKELEFDMAEFGSLGTQTLFSMLVNSGLDLNTIIDKIAVQPRLVFGLQPVGIQVGQKADFTLFDPNLEYVFTEMENKSGAKNTGLFDQNLKGKALGLVSGTLLAV
ncbi:MAG: dihydroorotase [Leadbetterella sp.]